jgi:glycosyltransferase involved in cell wall biosynthesis
MDIDLSIIVPLYNEEACVNPLYTSLKEECNELGLNYEFVFIDDGSTDSTYELLSALHDGDPQVKVIRFRKNYGQTAAMAAGFAYAHGGIIVSMDGDLQNDPVDIPRLIAKIAEGFDVVCGWRKSRQDKFWTRRLPSVVANWLIGRLTGVRIHDNGCSLKAYRARVIKNVPLYGEMHRFIPAMSTLTGARITEIAVHHHPRRFGKSKYGIGRIWRVALDIIMVKMITDFASRPGLWFGLLGGFSSLFGLGALCAAAGLYIGGSLKEWTLMSMAASLFLFLGTHLLAMGAIGELSLKTGDFRPKALLHSTTLVR